MARGSDYWFHMPWESTPDAPRTATPAQMPDNAQQHQVLLYDAHGRPLVERRPRPLGFRPPQPSSQEAERTP